jgi:metal-responsive CopG/Arc/MetJ family transcriptional regulator
MKRYEFYLDEDSVKKVDSARLKMGKVSRSAFLRMAIIEKMNLIRCDDDNHQE